MSVVGSYDWLEKRKSWSSWEPFTIAWYYWRCADSMLRPYQSAKLPGISASMKQQPWATAMATVTTSVIDEQTRLSSTSVHLWTWVNVSHHLHQTPSIITIVIGHHKLSLVLDHHIFTIQPELSTNAYQHLCLWNQPQYHQSLGIISGIVSHYPP